MQLATIGHSATMTSLEISELVESRHDKIKQSIERLAATFDGKGNPKTPVITLPPMGEVPNQGPGPKMISVYLVGKRDSPMVKSMTRKITDLKRKIVATTGAEAFIGRAVAVQIAGREVILVADSMVACNEVMRAIGIDSPNARLSNAVAVIQQKNCVVVEKS